MPPTGLVATRPFALPPTYDPYEGTASVPTYAGSTNFGQPATTAPRVNDPSSDYIDDFGNRYRYVDYGNGTGEWLLVSNRPGVGLVRPQDEAEVFARTRNDQQLSSGAANGGAGSGNFWGFTSVGGGPGPVTPGLPGAPGTPRFGPTGVQGTFSDYQALMNDTSQSTKFDATNQVWQDAIGGATWGAIQGRNDAVAQQQRDTQSYIDALNNARAQQQGFVDTRNQQANDALSTYDSTMDPIIGAINGLQAPTWQDFNSDPADIARQTQSYNWMNGVAGGSLDYQAALADYQTYQAQLAQLYQYQSNPEDVQRQLTGLGNIQEDILHGGDRQREILGQIYEDIRSGGDGQRDAIERLKQELATGGADQREVLEKYKALSNPEVTAQERYLAEIARRSFESQDRSSREAVMQDLGLRGLRSGGAEIAGALASQERLGQDRTLAELGLQANAVQRSMVALQGWQGSADSLRAAQQQGLALYTSAQNALRAAQQQGMALAAEEENALREAQQRGLAMYQNAADSIRAMNDQVGLANTGWANQNSMFNANAQNEASQFNANAYNQNSMFNANAQNQASANNQSTRLSGGIAAGNMANSIRSMNDAIGMFNTSGSQASQQFAAQFGLQKQGALAGIAQQGFQNTNLTNDGIFERNSGLTQMDRENAGLSFGARTGTNIMAGDAGSKNLTDILTGFGGFTAGATTLFGMTEAERERKARAAAEATAIAARGGRPRMS